MMNTLPERIDLYNFAYETDLTKRIDAVHKAPHYFLWIDIAWAVMLMKKNLLPANHLKKIAGTLLELWEKNDPEFGGFGGVQKHVILKHGLDIGGSLTLARTIPPLRQILPLRHKLMKTMCTLLDLREALLNTAEENLDAIMPGYTHLRHAQPTTFGHYLMSIADPIERIWADVERSFYLMSLNELGCGALAGTSFDIDRNMTSEYLGLEGLIENSNDAVAYHDGYVQVAATMANIMSIMSRLALELNVWSTLEYDFLFVPWLTAHHESQELGGKGKSHSHLMPNKTGNSPYLERAREGASETLGALVEVVSMGMRTFQGDMHEMLQFSKGASKAVDAVHEYTHVFIYTLPRITVKKDKMLAMARRGYSCATELASELVRRYNYDYRTAHMIVYEFVHDSESAQIESRNASLEVFDNAALKIVKKKLDLTESELRNILDPAYTVPRMTSQGGNAPEEVARMIALRREVLKQDKEKYIAKIEKLERARKKLEDDLKKLASS